MQTSKYLDNKDLNNDCNGSHHGVKAAKVLVLEQKIMWKSQVINCIKVSCALIWTTAEHEVKYISNVIFWLIQPSPSHVFQPLHSRWWLSGQKFTPEIWLDNFQSQNYGHWCYSRDAKCHRHCRHRLCKIFWIVIRKPKLLVKHICRKAAERIYM